MKRLLCIFSVMVLALSTPAFAEEDLDTTIEVLAEEAEKSPWSGGFDLGAYMTKGNTDTRGIILGANVKREDEQNIFAAFLTYLYSEDQKIRSQNELIVGARYDYKFGNETDWYAFAGTEWERDEFENLDLRAMFFAGLGKVLVKNDELEVKVETAPAVTYLDYWDPAGDEWVAEWIFTGWAEWKITDQLTGRQMIRIIPNLSHTPDYRMNWVTELESPVAEGVAGKISFIWDRNTRPAAGAEEDDYKLLISVVFRF